MYMLTLYPSILSILGFTGDLWDLPSSRQLPSRNQEYIIERERESILLHIPLCKRVADN